MRRSALIVFCFMLAGCAAFGGPPPEAPVTPSELLSGNNYVPLDPLPVAVLIHGSCLGRSLGSVLKNLPDNSVRIAVRQLDVNGSATFAPVKLGMQGSSYQVILDYVNVNVANMRFHPEGGDIANGQAPLSLQRIDDDRIPAAKGDFVIPVYVGIGLRLTANVTVRKGNVNLTSLPALAAAADAQKITGSLIVQTLGITGKQVTGSLPLPSELSSTTIQNAMQSMGSIKAIVYDEPDTILDPRVIGMYYPLNDQRTINLIVSELARTPVPFWRTCPADPQAPVTPSTPGFQPPAYILPPIAPERG
jgi:hypothetical protein